jgi:hypothetical protein
MPTWRSGAVTDSCKGLPAIRGEILTPKLNEVPAVHARPAGGSLEKAVQEPPDRFLAIPQNHAVLKHPETSSSGKNHGNLGNRGIFAFSLIGSGLNIEMV